MDSLNQHEIMGRWDEIIDSGGKCSDTEYAFLKKMIAASLSQKLGVDQIRNPLSLVNLTPELSDPVGLSGTQLDYVNGIKQYCQAHAHFDDTIGQQKSLAKGAQEQEEITEKEKAMNKENLELQLQVARLQKEHNQRQIVLKYLRELGKLPAALPDFLDPEALYENCSPMPEMPKQMIQGFATDHSATDAQAEELLQNLKKHVLRSKLVAQKQQVDYERSQAEKPFDFANMSPEAKLHALNAVKDGLINWVETQLVKAGDDGAGSDTEDKATERGADHDHEAMMAGIQQKYQRHLELRQQIINELAQLDHIKDGITTAAEKSLQQLQTKGSPQEPPNPAYTPEAYLITPYIEQLQTLARQQKSIGMEKMHIKGSLAKQQEDSREMLDRLVADSQLLSRYPVAKEPSKPRIEFEDDLDDRASIRDQVKPFIYAADSAKLATLVEVAENVEVGMESVEEARKYLEQVCKLLNVPFQQVVDEATQKDVANNPESSPSPGKERAPKRDDDGSIKSIWDILDGNLGSINEY